MAIGSHLYDDQQERAIRSFVLAAAVSLLFMILIGRLVCVQVVDAERNIRLSTENRMQLRVLSAPRGHMVDRNGEILARNRPSYSICVLPYKLQNRQRVIENLCLIRDSSGAAVFDKDELEQAFNRARRRRFDITRLRENVSFELVSIIEEHAAELPGIVVETESRREYPMGPSAFHALGYMSEIPESEFDSLKSAGYAYGDMTGKSGLERQYENVLRGVNGQEFVEVNAFGKAMGSIADMPRRPPTPGHDLVLTIDARLQQIAAESFPDTLRGAAVALDPRNGEVLMMLSRPSVDPNIFSLASSERSKEWQSVALDSAQPLNNRATVGSYTPGSTFKLFSSLAGLASERIGRLTHMARSCNGVYYIGRLPKACWNAKGHGSLTVTTAIQKSCNVFFYQLGLVVGDSTINKYASMCGLGVLTGIDLPSERLGWLSGEAAFNIRHKKRGWVWTDGLQCDHAIGQTQYFTPISLAVAVGTLGTGRRMRPHLLREVRTHDGEIVQTLEAVQDGIVEADADVLQTVRDGMRMVLETGGTAGSSRVPCVVVGGKTGSAEWKKGEKTHGLYVACAPMDNPEIAIAVVLENAGHGGAVAAPIAGKILRYYFSQIAPRIDCPEYAAMQKNIAPPPPPSRPEEIGD